MTAHTATRLLLILGLGLSAAAATPESLEPDTLRLELRPAAQVDAAGIHLEQLLVSPPADLPRIHLAPAPSPGQTLALKRDRIGELLRQHAPRLATTNWSGAAEVKISRRVRTLDEPEIKNLLAAALQRDFVKDKGELEIRFTRPWSAVTVVDEPLSLKVLDLPAAGVTPNCIVRFELAAADEILGAWQVPVHARVWREVWVAGSVLQRGRTLQGADVMRERRDVLALRDAVVSLDLDNPWLELGENVPAGAPLTARSLRMRPIVRRGKVADAVVQDGTMTLSVKVEVLEDGLPGQTIRVRNAKSKREFRGKVQNEETILVNL